MPQTPQELYQLAQEWSARANMYFAERDAQRQQAINMRAGFDELKLRYEPVIANLQEEANALADEFRQLYQAARDAYAAEDGAAAKSLSMEGRASQELCQELNTQRMELIEQLSTQRAAINEAFAIVREKHQQAISCIEQAKRLREQARQLQIQMGSDTSPKVYSIEMVPIRLTRERQLHIASDHPEMKRQMGIVLKTVQELDTVLYAKKEAKMAVKWYPITTFNKGMYVVVVYKLVGGTDGFVLTAYFRSTFPEGKEVLWQR